MPAKAMERMVYAARRERHMPQRWVMTGRVFAQLKDIAARSTDELDAPRLAETDPPTVMGIPIEIGTPLNREPADDLITIG